MGADLSIPKGTKPCIQSIAVVLALNPPACTGLGGGAFCALLSSFLFLFFLLLDLFSSLEATPIWFWRIPVYLSSV